MSDVATQNWRINFYRRYTTDNEIGHEVFWASTMRGIECQSCQMAYLNNIEPPKQERGAVEYIPSLVGGYSQDFSNDSTSDNFEPSLFVKYPISSVDLLEVALNPDFSQIESDDIQNDINTVNGLDLREYPSMVGKIVDTLDYGISVKILNKTGEFFEIDGKKGQWAEIETYNPYGHRQHLFPDNDGRTVFVNEISELDTYLECEMCGYCLLYTSPSPRDRG